MFWFQKEKKVLGITVFDKKKEEFSLLEEGWEAFESLWVYLNEKKESVSKWRYGKGWASGWGVGCLKQKKVLMSEFKVDYYYCFVCLSMVGHLIRIYHKKKIII